MPLHSRMFACSKLAIMHKSGPSMPASAPVSSAIHFHCSRPPFTSTVKALHHAPPHAGIVLTNDGHAILREIDVTHPAAKVRENAELNLRCTPLCYIFRTTVEQRAYHHLRAARNPQPWLSAPTVISLMERTIPCMRPVLPQCTSGLAAGNPLIFTHTADCQLSQCDSSPLLSVLPVHDPIEPDTR